MAEQQEFVISGRARAFSAPMLFRVERLVQRVFAKHSKFSRSFASFPAVMEGDRDLAVIKGGCMKIYLSHW